MSKILEVQHLNKYFTNPVEFHALKDINFHINAGEFVSIMGKSGCGKSTLLYILSTMDTNYTGELVLEGHKLSDKKPDDLAKIRNEFIGFVFQFHYLLPEFSVLDNVMLPARKLGIKSMEEIRIDAMRKLELLGVEKEANKRASMISGGQKQRVAIARALINSPRIIMGDEPTGNLDSKNTQVVFSLFKELCIEEKMSLLIVTHDPDFAAKTDRIITMEDGRVIKQ